MFWRNPREFIGKMQEKLGTVYGAEPNYIHKILSEWERRGKVLGIVTQNVDGLHKRAGSENVVEYHGTLLEYTRYSEEGVIESREVPYSELLIGASIDIYRGGKMHKPNMVLFNEDVRNKTPDKETYSGCGVGTR